MEGVTLDLRISDYELLFTKICKDDTCRCREVDASKLPMIRDFRRLRFK